MENQTSNDELMNQHLSQQIDAEQFSTPIDSTRKKLITTFCIWVLVLSNLFYNENLGLNALIAALITIPLFGILHKKTISKLWFVAATIWLITAFGVFINPTATALTAYFFSFIFLTAVNNSTNISMPFGLVMAIGSFTMGIGDLFTNFFQAFEPGKKKIPGKKLVTTLAISIPIIIGIIFLKLYQSADATFYELTKFINLDWISWGFIVFYLFSVILLYGFFFFTTLEDVQSLDEGIKLDTEESYSDKIQRFFGVQNETKIAFSLLIILNVLLLLYNLIDLNYLFVELNSSQRALSISEVVHGGINSLIASLILAIIIISFLFRGALNFAKNKFLKILALGWLIQNIVMVITTSIKNVEYVSQWGLTYKRIGVYIYLLLAVVGICITIYKIIKKKSFWFLIKSCSLVFSLVLVSLLTFNWNRVIASYNLAHVKQTRIDFSYLLELGPDTYGAILTHHQNVEPVDNWVLISINDQVNNNWERSYESDYEPTWRSFNWSDEQVKRDLAKVKFNFE